MLHIWVSFSIRCQFLKLYFCAFDSCELPKLNYILIFDDLIGRICQIESGTNPMAVTNLTTKFEKW